jgi:Outer membrane protein beta-barrel domain
MRCFYAFLLVFVFSALASAQESRADLFGGYSYLNIDTNGLTSSRQNANGWDASLSGNFNRWFAAEAEVAGYYKDYGAVSVTDYSYGAGPRINFKPLFVHALIGGDHLTGSAGGVSVSQDSLAGAFGGGVQWRVSGPFSIRASADYVFTRHNILGGPSVTQGQRPRLGRHCLQLWPNRPCNGIAASIDPDGSPCGDESAQSWSHGHTRSESWC